MSDTPSPSQSNPTHLVVTLYLLAFLSGSAALI
jgi:hypothetical protein